MGISISCLRDISRVRFSCDDETAKRASTEEESESCVSKKPRVEDEDDTSMDEDDSDIDEYSWEVDPNDDIYAGVGSGIDYLNMREEEPEWDKDSYDGYECVFIPKERFATDEKYEVYCHDKIEAFKNKGFLPDPWRSVYAMANLESPWSHTTKREYLADIASFCVKKLNEEKGTTVEFVSIVRCNLKGGCGWKLYITFMAREYLNGPLVEYQAKAMDFGEKLPFPILCRRAPS